MKFIFKHWKAVLLILTFFFLLGSLIIVIFYGNEDATTFNQNILVEFFIGGTMLLIPTIIAIQIGEKLTKNIFYNDIGRLISRISEERKNGNLTKEGARNIVKEASSIFGREVLEDPLFNRLPRSTDPITYEKKNCGVCGLKAQISINKHCSNCKLDCFTWEKFIDS